MEILEVINRIIDTKLLLNGEFRWCFVNEKKAPMKKNGLLAKPNSEKDFVDLYSLVDGVEEFDQFKGVGISVNFSKVSAIDIDKCVDIPFDKNSINQLGKDILKMFKDYYCEFSFSGTGLRIIFKTTVEENYQENFYIKNSNNNIEFYDHTFPARYVTLTGDSIYNNSLKEVDEKIFKVFLDTYMKRVKRSIEVIEQPTMDKEEIKKRLRILLLNNSNFQNRWFSKAPGSNSNESELDYFLMATIYEHITTDSTLIKKILENSDYYKSKDAKHKRKWNTTNYVESTINRMRK